MDEVNQQGILKHYTGDGIVRTLQILITLGHIDPTLGNSYVSYWEKIVFYYFTSMIGDVTDTRRYY